MAAVCVQCIWMQLSGFLLIIFLLFIAGFCVFLEAFAMDIYESLVNMNISVNNAESPLGYSQLIKRFADTVSFHANAKELVYPVFAHA